MTIDIYPALDIVGQPFAGLEREGGRVHGTQAIRSGVQERPDTLDQDGSCNRRWDSRRHG